MRARTPFRLILAFALVLGCAGLPGPGSAMGRAATVEIDRPETAEPAARSAAAPLPASPPALLAATPPTPTAATAATAATVLATPTVATPPLTTSLPDVAGSVFRVVGAFAVVMAVFLGGVWTWRNWQRLTSRASRRQDLKVVECKSLGARQALWVIAYRKQRLLVASSPAGIVLVSALPEAEAEEAVEAPAPDFAAAFRQVLGRGA